MHQINYELIGSMPKLDAFRDTLPKLIELYEASKPTSGFEDLKSMPQQEREDYLVKVLQREDVLDRLSMGVTIELCAAHFYGIDQTDSIAETIELIRAADDELEHGK